MRPRLGGLAHSPPKGDIPLRATVFGCRIAPIFNNLWLDWTSAVQGNREYGGQSQPVSHPETIWKGERDSVIVCEIQQSDERVFRISFRVSTGGSKLGVCRFGRDKRRKLLEGR